MSEPPPAPDAGAGLTPEAWWLSPWWLVAAAYLAGSIPFGLLVSRLRGVDIRAHGSKNIGATNVWRVLGWKAGLSVFILDALKGFAPTALAGWALGAFGTLAAPHGPGVPTSPWGELLWVLTAAAAIIGHTAPVWLGFRGGKGVATSFGALLGLWPALGVPALGALGVWGATLALSRYVGLSSCVAALMLPVLAYAHAPIILALGLGERPPPPRILSDARVYAVVTGLLAVLVIWRHRGNLRRTLAGTEPRVGI